MSHDFLTIGVAMVTGAGASWFSTRVALAVAVNDIRWLKDEIVRAHSRIDRITV
jgi:hypothetical protein